MNCNGSRISSGGAAGTVAHVLNAENNETVEIIGGDPEQMNELDQLAQVNGQKYSLRHFIINPERDLSDEQWDRAIEMHKKEFGWGDREHAIVAHRKVRADGSTVEHRHLLVEDADQNGKILHIAHQFQRNEKLSRMMEYEFGHKLIRGKHNRAVINALEKEGRNDVADAMKEKRLDQGKPALAQFSSRMNARAKRLDVSLPTIANDCKKAMGARGAGLALAIAERDQGVTIRRGDRRDSVVMEKDGEVIANVNKMFKPTYTTDVLMRALQDGRKHLIKEERQNVAKENRRHDYKANSESHEDRRGRSQDEPSSVQPNKGKYRGDLDRATRSPGSRHGATSGANGEGTRGIGRDGASYGQGDAGARSSDHSSTGSSHRCVSEAASSGNRASALQNLKTNAAFGSAFKKHGNFPSCKSGGGSYPVSSYGGSPIPDPSDPHYVEKVMSAWEKSMRQAAAAAEAAWKANQQPPPSYGKSTGWEAV